MHDLAGVQGFQGFRHKRSFHMIAIISIKCRVEKNNDYLNRIFFIYLIFFKSGIHNVIKYLTIGLSGVNTAT